MRLSFVPSGERSATRRLVSPFFFIPNITASFIGIPVEEPAFYFALGIVAESVDFGFAVQFHPEVPEEFIVIVKLGCAPELGPFATVGANPALLRALIMSCARGVVVGADGRV